MKSILLTLFSICSLFAFSQNAIQKIAEHTCECADFSDLDLPIEEVKIKFGFCIFEEAGKHKKELKKKFNIDLDNIETAGEELGRLVALEMVGKCPKVMMAFTKDVIKEKEETQQDEVYDQLACIGTVSKIDESDYVKFIVKNDGGMNTTLHWIHFVENEIDLELNYKELIGKAISAIYTEVDVFDPKIQEYRTINVLSSLNIAE